MFTMSSIELLAQGGGGLRNMQWDFGTIAIAAVVIAGVIALVWVAFDYFKVTPPPWAVRVFWIVVVVVVIVFAIKLVLSMW